MRRSIVSRPGLFSLVSSVSILPLALAAFGLTGCEDGPAQTYNPAPPGAGDLLNDGKTAGSVDPTKATFDLPDAASGTNKQILCDGPTTQKTWAAAFSKPVLPPQSAGGIDIAGGPSWQGLTIEDAEDPKKGGLCQSTNAGDIFGNGTLANYWGDNAELVANYRVSNHKIIGMLLRPGYLGTINLTSRDKKHTYTIPISTQVQKDGVNWDLHWATTKNFLDEASELYDAMIATFAPSFPQDTDCQSSRRCIIGSFGDVAYFYVPALGSALWIPNRNAAQPAPSILNRIDQDLAKVMPYSFADPYLKLDAVGPVGLGGKLGTATAACTLTMGLAYGDFLQNCVQNSGDPAKDQTELNKLLGGLTHGTERFHFDVQGVDVNFTDNRLGPEAIVSDTDLPAATDTATDFAIDQSTLGRFANDRVGNDPTAARDNHGAGLVYLEYARLVQDGLAKYFPGNEKTLGDPKCLAPAVDPTNPVYPTGCTGFEGFISHYASAAFPRNAVGHDLSTKISAGYDGGLKPGHLQAAFCLDATGVATDYQLCTSPTGSSRGDIVGSNGDLFATSFNRVLAVMGQNKVTNLPSEAQDVRFFFRLYVIALLKYLTVAGDPAKETPDGVHGVVIDPDNLFFDSIGAGQFEIGEYVDRRFASKTVDPIDIVVTADVKNGIFNSYDFSRDILRGETALYVSMLENQADGVGQENTALLTNMFGSPILNTAWKDIPDPANPSGPPLATAYYCATTLDKAKCTITSGGATTTYTPPLDAKGNVIVDETGRPLLAPYKGAFGISRTSWTLGTTPVTVSKTLDAIQQAVIKIPLHKDPYDQTSDPPPGPPALSILVPWAPKQPGIGFPVALTGTRDKFIETYQLDLSGNTISANIDYDVVLDGNGNPVKTGDITLKAVETTDFLGNVFLCKDDVSKDLLAVEMYTPVATILEWLAAHPGTYQSCGIIIRYSPYGNYADFITSLTNGVRLGITQGGGFGRVVDVTLFTPGQ
jgi:hypothetical protein